jgi:hypothetical protein
MSGTNVQTHRDDPALPTPHNARAIETWLEGLRTCAGDGDAPADREDRTLFVLDNDFGELTTIMYLVLGQPCFRDARILASPRLYETNKDALPGRVALWKTEQDIAQAIDAFQPKVVVLASGYLLPIHRLLTTAAIARIRTDAERQGAVVVTADPFLGLVSQCPPEDLHRLISIDIPDTADANLVAAKKIGDALLHTALAEAEAVLRDTPHLYPSYTDMAGVKTHDTDARTLSFFNPALVVPNTLPTPDTPPAEGDDAPYWMFLISLVDYQTQCMFEGAEPFARIVADRLTEAVGLGRRAILLAPSELIYSLKALMPADGRIQLLTFCPFARAMSLLLAAEYCFYWNLVSHSIIMQLWNGRPIILFDRGHLARAIPAIHQRILAWYYQGWEPPYLDHKDTLSLAVLEAAVADHRRDRDQIVARYRRAPSPAAMIRALVEGGAGIASSPPISAEAGIQAD